MNTVFSIHRQHQPASRRKSVRDHSRRFECSYCSKSFTRSEHLRRHERGHTKERPFTCTFCRRAFVRKDILSRHLKSFHPDLGGPGEDCETQLATTSSAVDDWSILVDFPSIRNNTKSVSRRRPSRDSVSSNSYEESPISDAIETTRPSNATPDLTYPNSVTQSSQLQNQVGSVTSSSDKYTHSHSCAAVQKLSPLRPANTNTNETTDSEGLGLLWAESHQLMEDGHFSYDNGIGSPVIVDENAFDLLSEHADEHGMSENSATTDIQQHLLPKDSATFQMTTSQDVDIFWTEEQRQDNNSHLPCDDNVSNQVSLANIAFGDSYSPLLSPSSFLQSLEFPAKSINTNQQLCGPESQFPGIPGTNEFRLQASTENFSPQGEPNNRQNTPASCPQQSSRWMDEENESDHSSRKKMPFAEKLYIEYPSVCPNPDLLPTTNAFLRYIKFYFRYFSPQLPFLHQLSFNLWTQLPALSLSVSSIGAIYAAEHETGFSLHCLSKHLLKQLEEDSAFSKSKTPLEHVQADFLNMIFAAWSGDARGVKYASSLQSSIVAKVTHLLKDAETEVASHLKQGSFPDSKLAYEDVKRLFYVVYIASAAFCSALGSNPLLFNHDCLSIRLPCEEEEWAQQRGSPPNAIFTASVTPIRFEEALSLLSDGKTCLFGPFQLRILIAALYLEFWQASCLSRVGADESSSPWKSKIKRMLSSWKDCFQAGSESRKTAYAAEHERPTSEHPLADDALALYRHIQVELVVPLRPFGLQLQDFDAAPKATAEALWGLRVQLYRSPEMTEAMNYCLETLRLPLSKGSHFVGLTGPLYWSVEHVPLGSILCILICLWTSRLTEPDAAPVEKMEKTILQRLIDMLRDAGYRPQMSNLPSVVAEVWETMLDSSCYVWKVTPEYVKLFRSCAQIFVDTINS